MLVAERGVVFFRDQELDIDQQLQLGCYYGPLHVHQNLGHPKGYPEVLVVEKSVEGSERILQRQAFAPDNRLATRPTSVSRRCSERFIEGLTAVHSSKGQAERYGGKAIKKDYGGVVAAEDKDDILSRVAPAYCQHGHLQAPSPAAPPASGRA
ncbi:hypothetical protein PF001_g20432, partial [Phytophthora fragariae]